MNSLAFAPTAQYHGLQNKIGENNCFLNVTIQALWHLGPFRAHLKALVSALSSEANLLSNSSSTSLLAALCNLFVQYEFTEEDVLPPTELRESLGKLSEKFQLGAIADANEALDAILQRIHTELSSICPDRQKCLSHAAFGGMILEQTICKDCGASSEPAVRSNFLLYFQAMEIISEAKAASPPITLINANYNSIPAKPVSSLFSFSSPSPTPSPRTLKLQALPVGELSKSVRFGKMLKKCMMALGDRSCPGIEEGNSTKSSTCSTQPPSSQSSLPMRCSGKANVFFFSLEPPLALALSLSWDNARQSIDNLHILYSCISERIYLQDLFSDDINTANATLHPLLRSVSEMEQPLRGPSYLFRGIVCYYGNHYISIFQEMTGIGTYYLFDDQKVRPVGDWVAVVKLCLASLYQPVLLLYELERGTAAMDPPNSDVLRELLVSQCQPCTPSAPPAPVPLAVPEPLPEPLPTAPHMLRVRRDSVDETMRSEEDEDRLDAMHPQRTEKLGGNGMVRFDPKALPSIRNGKGGGRAKPVLTMSATDRFMKGTIDDRPFDELDEQVDAVRLKWKLPSLRPSGSQAAMTIDIDNMPFIPIPKRAPLMVEHHPEPFVDLSNYHPQPTDPNYVEDRNPYRSLYATSPSKKEAQGPKYNPIITHWSRRFHHYSVNIPVMSNAEGVKTVGLVIVIDEECPDKYPMLIGFAEDGFAVNLLPQHITDRIHLFDHIIQVNNIPVDGLQIKELLESIGALVQTSEIITFHFQSAHAHLYFYCRVCNQPVMVDRKTEERLAKDTDGGKRTLMRAVRIPCQHCETVGLAVDYMT